LTLLVLIVVVKILYPEDPNMAVENKQELKATSSKQVLKQNKSLFFIMGAKKLKTSAITAKICKYFRNGRYPDLSDELVKDGITEKEKKAFFLAEGYGLLHWAVNRLNDARALDWLCEVFSQETVKETFSQKDFKIFKDFLLLEAELEKMDLRNEASNEVRIEKIKILLRVDPETVTNFMQNHSDEKLKSDYVTASERIAKLAAAHDVVCTRALS
jgi:hypothetical protein